jgi:hypothetical protein
MKRKEIEPMNADEIVRELGHRADAANKRGYSGEASEWIELADLIESLQAQLADERRRADAAVEDMKVGWLCRACIKRVKGKEWCNCPAVNFVNGPEKTTTCDNFDWRGPVAGKGGKDG